MPVSISAAAKPPTGVAIGMGVTSGRSGPRLPAGITAATAARRGFEGKPGQTLVVVGEGPTRILVGLGDGAAVTSAGLRGAAAAVVRAAWNEAALALDLVDALPAAADRAAGAQAVAEGALLAGYTFDAYRTNPKPCRIESVTVVGKGARGLASGVARGATIAAAVALARDLVNTPPGDMNPSDLATVAETMAAAAGLECTVWDEHDIERERLGALRGVSLGSAQPPRFVKLTYTPVDGAKGRALRRLAIVGKGITFDSGGLSLKTPEGMTTMKNDMTGAAVVIATMQAVAALEPDVQVIGYCAITENMPGPAAIKPSDVLRARNGKTIEVLNTDAEGRLVLADALSVAAEDGADAIVDLATLTGAIISALGKDVSGLFSNHEGFAAQVLAAGQRAGEQSWQLPVVASYRKHLDSEVADMKNIGLPGQAGSIVAALFLEEYVAGKPWVHLDIAGTARVESDDGFNTRGGTGVGVRTLVELIDRFERPDR